MKKNIKIILIILIIFVVLLPIFYFGKSSFSFFKKTNTGNENINVANFGIKLNNSTNLSQTIDLNTTITENNYSNNYLMPGTNGVITLVLDFTDVDVSTDYSISFGVLNLPTNLKFYTDSNHTNLFTSYNGTYLVNGTNSYTYSIYWLWEYRTDDTSNTNDNLYMNQNLSVPVIVTASQKIGGGN